MTYPSVKFGISSWTFPWSIGGLEGPQPSSRLTALGLLQKAKDLDVRLLQIADNLPLENLSRSELSELRNSATEWGISLEVGTKGINPDHLMKLLDIAVQLNSPIIRTLPGSFVKKTELSEVEMCVRKVLPTFEKAGVVKNETEAGLHDFLRIYILLAWLNYNCFDRLINFYYFWLLFIMQNSKKSETFY